MTGIDAAGQRLSHTRRSPARPVPRGKLASHQVRDLQSLLARGLASQGYTGDQIAQVIALPPRTLDRRMAVATARPC